MRHMDLERAEQAAQFSYTKRAVAAVQVLRLRQQLERAEAELLEATEEFERAEERAAALRPIAGVVVRARLGVVA